MKKVMALAAVMTFAASAAMAMGNQHSGQQDSRYVRDLPNGHKYEKSLSELRD